MKPFPCNNNNNTNNNNNNNNNNNSNSNSYNDFHCSCLILRYIRYFVILI